MTQLEQICLEVIAPAAPAVDREGAFPSASIEALAAAGFLGAVSSPEAGGLNLGFRGAANIVRRVAQDCGSTAMVLCMHYCGTSVLEGYAPLDVRRAAASGAHLSTLAFSEAGSRSQFWVPVGTATPNGAGATLDARKSWITSASRATAYIWSSKPLRAEGLSTLWLVPAGSKGLKVHGPFDGLGLRGNDSAPVTAEGVPVPDTALLGRDGGGFEIMTSVVVPWFAVLNSACTVGLMEAAVERTIAHVTGTRFDHLDSSLASLPTIRNYVARMRVKTDMARTLLDDAITAVETGRADTLLRLLESKAAAGETATEVLDLAMRVCGGAAFRREVGVERYFRDTRAAGVMGPTTDVLYEFIGKAVCGMPVF